MPTNKGAVTFNGVRWRRNKRLELEVAYAPGTNNVAGISIVAHRESILINGGINVPERNNGQRLDIPWAAIPANIRTALAGLGTFVDSLDV